MAVSPLLRCGLAFALAACLCEPGVADDRFGCAQPLRLAFYRNELFYRDGHGIDPDLIAELARRSGCRFDTSVRSRADIWLALQRGELDVATSGVATDERRRYAFFVPYLYLRNKLIVPIELAPDLRSLDDFQRLPGARLGVIAGYDLGPFYDGMLKILRGQGRVLDYPDDAARFKALLDGQVEGAIGHELNLVGTVADAAQRRRFRVVDVAPGPGVGHGLVLARGHFSAAQSAAWQRLIEDLRLDGGLARIMLRNAPLDVAAGLTDSGYRFASEAKDVAP